MLAIRSLGIRPAIRNNLLKSTSQSLLFKSRIATVKATDNDEDQILIAQRKNRPVSPHLDIYQPQLTWILSGAHRATGVFLAAGFYGITCTYAAASLFGFHFDAALIFQTIEQLPEIVKYGFKAVLAYPFAFHMFNGLRHFVWDTGREFSIKAIYRTGYIVLAATAIFGSYLTFL